LKDNAIEEDNTLGIYPNSVCTLRKLVHDVIGYSIGFESKQATVKQSLVIK